MAFNADKSLFDFSKLSITNPRELAPNDPIDILLGENNLARKHLPKGPNSLMRAISDSIHHSPHLFANIQESLVNHLKEMVSKTIAFPRRLMLLFKNNVLIKDYFINPQLSGFEKVNLELASSLFQVKVVIYTITEDNYLAATILNTNYENTIRLLRNKNNTYNAVFPQPFLEKLEFCNSIALSIIENALSNVKTSNPRGSVNINGNNSGYPVSIETNSTDDSPGQIRNIKSRHKKSLSDPFYDKGSLLEEQERMYNMFNNAVPPDDFFSKLRARKDTTESNFSLKANLDFIEEGINDASPDMPKYAIKNYPIPSSGLSSGPGSLVDLDKPMSKNSNMRMKNNSDLLFNENFSLAEVERLEKENLKAAQARNGGFMGNMQQQQQPGLFNNSGFLQKPHAMADAPHLQGNREYMYANMVPNVNVRKEEQMQNMGFGFNGLEGQRQQQMGYPQNYQGMMNNGRIPLEQIHGAPQLRKSESMRNMIQNGGGMFMGGPGFVPQQQHQLQQAQGMLTAEQIAMYQGFGGQQGKDNKKKSMIADDGSRRYTGKLKFFDEVKNYGFIIMDEDGSDIFVHFDDLSKAQIGKEMLRLMKMGKTFRLSFACMQYYGKYNKSRKAIDIEHLG